MVELNHVTVFANPNGKNDRSLAFIEALGGDDRLQLHVLSLAEQLAEYTNFPSPSRKSRLEDILASAATEAAGVLVKKISALGLKCDEPEILNGRFPDSVVKGLTGKKIDLLVKQSLPCDGEYGHVSKGDLRLSRHVDVPLLLLNHEIRRNGSVLVGVPPIYQDRSGLARATKVIQYGAFWAQKLEASLHCVHAWELFGESFLRSRASVEELSAELAKAEEKARGELAFAIENAGIPGGLKCQSHIHKGDPTRVLMAELELLKPSMVVLGSVANEGAKGVLLGNTAETVTRRKLTNTLIVK